MDIKAKFKNLKLRDKILLSYLLIIIFTVTVSTLLTYKKSSEIIERQTIDSTRQSFEQASNFISYKLNNVKDVSSMLFMNKEIQNILSKNPESYTLKDQIDDFNKLTDILLSMQNSREIYNIRLYVSNDYIYSKSGNKILSEKEISGEEWYVIALNNNGSISWRSTYEYDFKDMREKQNLISIVRTINSEGFHGKHLGVISIDILEKSIYEIVKQVGLTTSGQVFLVDDEGKVISSNGKTPLGTDIAKEKYYSEIQHIKEGYRKFDLNNEASIVYHKHIENTNWRLVSIIPVKEMLKDTNQISTYMIIVVMLITLVAAIVAYYISGGITNRIRQLIKNMRKIEQENWDVNIVVDSTDEIGDLQNNFNHMIDNMRILIEEKYEAEINKKSAELRALQAQINPHFLYNILDMICWMALKYGAEDIVYIVSSLAKFFRLSLSDGKDIVPIEDEINHVKMYLDIQMKRFPDGVEGIIDVSEDILKYSTVKLILQPIVENAIIHGIQESDDKKGYVKIIGKREGDLIVFTIEDNGKGMDEATINTLVSDKNDLGYGVKNVNERIKLYFSKEFGLIYHSEINKGTVVTITFPVLPYSDNVKSNI